VRCLEGRCHPAGRHAAHQLRTVAGLIRPARDSSPFSDLRIAARASRGTPAQPRGCPWSPR
jgi:hypothetical protein